MSQSIGFLGRFIEMIDLLGLSVSILFDELSDSRRPGCSMMA